MEVVMIRRLTTQAALFMGLLTLAPAAFGMDRAHRRAQEELTRQLLETTNAERARELLAQGADPNVCHENRDPILTRAIALGNTRMVDYLLDAGASAERLNACGAQPIHVAVASGNPEMVQTLLQRGVHLEAHTQGNGQWTPLHLAAKAGALQLAAQLIEHGACLNARGHRLETPLHLAAESNLPPMAQLLLDAGADPDATDQFGQRADNYFPGSDIAQLVAAHRQQSQAFARHCQTMEQEIAAAGLKAFFAHWRAQKHPAGLSSEIASFICGQDTASWMLLEDEDGNL